MPHGKFESSYNTYVRARTEMSMSLQPLRRIAFNAYCCHATGDVSHDVPKGSLEHPPFRSSVVQCVYCIYKQSVICDLACILENGPLPEVR